MIIAKSNKPVLVRREVTRYGRVGDLFTACLADDALWEDDSVCQCDFVICTKPYASCDPYEVTGLTYKLMAREHNSMLKASPILNISEKRYLSDVIRPFRNQVTTIVKVASRLTKKAYICIRLGDKDLDDRVCLPFFKIDSMYLKMEAGKLYTPDELGL